MAACNDRHLHSHHWRLDSLYDHTMFESYEHIPTKIELF